MGEYFWFYITVWGICLAVATCLIIYKHKSISLLSSDYFLFLLVPWKLITFLIAATGLVVVGPFTGDPTWDYATSSFMSVFTFLFAPWTIGILYRALIGKESISTIYIAICLWLFSASWSYDAYLLLRDGYYPVTWSANLFASSILFLCAGLFWNLTFSAKLGVSFAFSESDWPKIKEEQLFINIIWYAIPLMLLVSAMILYFLLPILKEF